MKYMLHLLLFAVISLMSGSIAHAAARCPPAAEPAHITINTAPAQVVYKTGRSRSDLERMHRAKGLHMGGGNWRVLGLTLTEFRYSIKTSAMLIPRTGGGYCAQPVSYDLNVRYSDFQVHIDRQYRRGSCEFNAIRDHENTHVALFRSNLLHYLPQIKRQARIASSTVKSVAVSDPDSGARNLQKQLQRHLDPLISKLNRASDAANARIDTPQSYRNVHQLCDNW